MGSVGSPNNWAPYDANYRECSQGICSTDCPQWCSMVFPPPPPFFPEEVDDDSKTNFSPLIIAIIGILASTVLLVIYYTLISKYCRRRRDHQNRINQLRSDQTQMDHHDLQWQVPSTGGLDEGLIKSIAVCKYKKGDGLVDGTECVVCLSEFQEDESLRLLPKCSHAFHLPCIDTWLKSHSNCPLCRASVVSGNSQSSSSTVNVSSLEVQRREDDLVFVVDGGREREGEVVVSFGGDEIDDSGAGSPSVGRFRRSISVDSFSCQADEDPRMEIQRLPPGIGSSGAICGDDRRSKDGNGLFDLVRSPVAGVKRSISTERFKITKKEKGKNSTIPV